MNEIAFTVPAIPVAQPRQRHAIRRFGNRSAVVNYTPQNAPVNSFKACVQMSARAAYQGPPIEGAVTMDLVFVMPRTKAMIWKSRPMPRAIYVKKPDVDNLCKSVFDAFNGVLLQDDATIDRISACKVYAAGNEQPHVEVVLRRS